MSYQSSKQKINEFIKQTIENLKRDSDLFRELDYNNFISLIQADLGVSESQVKECLDNFFKLNQFEEIHTIRLHPLVIEKQGEERRRILKEADEILYKGKSDINGKS